MVEQVGFQSLVVLTKGDVLSPTLSALHINGLIAEINKAGIAVCQRMVNIVHDGCSIWR